MCYDNHHSHKAEMRSHNTVTFKGNSIYVSVASQMYKALIDTGAGMNVVALKVVKSLPLHLQRRFKKKVDSCHVANGGVINTLGTIELPVCINRQVYSQVFTVFNECATDILLGVPFFEKFHAHIDFPNHTLHLSSEIPVHAPTHLTIPPQSEVVCVAHISHPVPNFIEGECENFKPISSKGLMSANIAVCPRRNKIPIRLFNTTNVAQKIKAHERIATFCPWKTTVEVENYTPKRSC